MIQFNLLPDVKLAFIKARRFKRLVIIVTSMVSALSVTAVIFLFVFVNVAQKKHISDINKNIQSNDKKLSAVNDLDKILTIQNQLNSLTALHDQKPETAKLFGYINQITPAQVSLSNLQINFTTKVLKISGDADTLSTVNKFVDTLKFTTFRIANQTIDNHVFSSTVLSNFAKDEKKSTYTIETVFDTRIFDSNISLLWSVPNIISTRSETEKPAALFQQSESIKAKP